MNNNRKYIKENIGKSFPFTIRDFITLPPENELSMIIQDEDKYHFTIAVKYYPEYGFKIGERWNFRLDSIDCDNHVIFEPHHPVYKERTVDTFEVISHKTIINHLEIKEEVLIVKDKLSNFSKIRLCRGITPNLSEIEAYIERIKYGELLLMPVKKGIQVFKLKSVQTYKICGQKTLPQLGKSFILKDNRGNLHPLPIEPFRGYKIRTGATINAQIRHISSKGFLYLEPMHPIYKPGEIYTFKVLDMIIEGHQVNVFLEDIIGNIVRIVTPQIFKKELVDCRIISIEKGLPILELSI
jgi:hypothetical protein